MSRQRDENSDTPNRVRPDDAALPALLRERRNELDLLDQRRSALVEDIRRLESQLSGDRHANHANLPDSKLPASAKLAIFRSLFRGRDDVYALRWENGENGRSGYAPATARAGRTLSRPTGDDREAVPARDYLPLTDGVIRAHLTGRHVVGIYPLLPDGCCRFVVADFDRGRWREDVTALAGACRHAGLQPAVERSRSGEGAHLWLFFQAPLPAALARRVVAGLLARGLGIARRAQSSFDRLIPAQDAVPPGGLGNLVALPLQRAARIAGNSLFVDDDFEPWPDQWAFLSRVVRTNADELAALDAQADETVRSMAVTNEGCQEAIVSPREVPDGPRFAATLDSRLRVARAGLAPGDESALCRTASFPNPEFFRRRRLRLSTARTPGRIECAAVSEHSIDLPRACQEDLATVARSLGTEANIVDRRATGRPLEARFLGDLDTNQRAAAAVMLEHDVGVLVAPPGSGKTVIGIHHIAARGRTTLVLVHRTTLVEQWIAQVRAFLDVDTGDVGRFRGRKPGPSGVIDIGTLQGLARRDDLAALGSGYGCVVVDECHHLPAWTFEDVLSQLPCRYVLGLTATPVRRDGLHPIMHMQLGPVRHHLRPEGDRRRHVANRVLVVHETSFDPGPGDGERSIQRLYSRLVEDEARNAQLVNDVIAAVDAGRTPLVLTERRAHLDWLVEQLGPFVGAVVGLSGGAGAKRNREALAAASDCTERVVVATGRFAGEGFDDPKLDTLFLAMPVSWRGTLEQYVGRLHRAHSSKQDVVVHDYVDVRVPMLARMHARRLTGYRAMGYVRADAAQSAGAQGELDLDP